MDLFDRILIVSTNLKPYSEDDIQELIQNKSAGISLTYSCNGVTNPISIFFLGVKRKMSNLQQTPQMY